MVRARTCILGVVTAALGLASASADENKSRFDEAISRIHQSFWQEVSRDELEDRALAALIRELDPYGRSLDQEEWLDFRGELNSSVAGVGVFLRVDEGSTLPEVDALLIDSAAGAAGVRRGDQIHSVDGRSLAGLDIATVIGLLRGDAGSRVRLAVARPGEELRTLEVVRKAHVVPSVHGVGRDPTGRSSFLLDPEYGLGYIRVAHLAADSLSAVEEALAQLTTARAEGLILDLRGSYGGLMDAAIGIADLFLAEGLIAGDDSREGPSRVEANPEVSWGGPLVVLIDGDTASSSEFLAAALKDHGRATFIGARTFGKGLVQRMFSLGEGRGGLVLTTGRHVRPSGVAADRHDAAPGNADAGVSPDPGYEMELEGELLEQWRSAFELRGSPAIRSVEELAEAGPDPVLERATRFLRDLISPGTP